MNRAPFVFELSEIGVCDDDGRCEISERRKIVTEAQAFRLLGLLDELTIELMPEPVARTASGLAQIARPHQLSAYDAIYLDLAIRLGLPLFTRDGNLRAAAARVGVPLPKEATR